MKKLLRHNYSIVFLVLLFIPSIQQLHGQTAARLEALIETPALSWEQAAAFIQEAAATDQSWLPKNTSPGDTARFNGVALILMRSFDINGGIFYRISKSPHHAYRELVYKNVIHGDIDPDMPVSGQQLLFMVSRILAMKEQ